jgi:CDP-glucose 4,6-dehydratase
MENLGKMNLTIYKDKKVFLTGHTGFKGSWMTYWLQSIGAEVVGYSLPPNTEPNHFELLKLDMTSHFNDICDLNKLQKAIKASKPDIIFHLAAQPLVRYSYQNPIETYQTNVIGTANVLEAARECESVKAIIVITTDKCYENIEQKKGYIESDKMGGYDPYSSSKGCAELVVSSYRNSFFNLNDFKLTHQTLLATARAGNVIGGGDWSLDRLIPDLIKGAVADKKTSIRYPKSTRPWQHVLDPIYGYLMLGEKLLDSKIDFASSWNFGPEENEILAVEQVLEYSKNIWNKINFEYEIGSKQLHEAGLLSLNIDKAKNILAWSPNWNNVKSITKTIEWYKDFYTSNKLNTDSDLKNYINAIC